MGIGKFEWGETRYDTLVDNGHPDKRLDIAIMGDGYAADEMELYRKDVDTLIAAFREHEPTATYFNHLNFHRLNIIAPETGIYDRYNVPERAAVPGKGLVREANIFLRRLIGKFPKRARSPLGSHFSVISPRRLVGWDWRVFQVANWSGAPYDSCLVIVNTPRRGGATRFWLTVGYASRNSSDYPEIMIHEAGHSIAKLNDEYVDPLFPNFGFLKGKRAPVYLPFANNATNPHKPKWHPWIEPDTTLPTQFHPDHIDDTVGAFEGATYTAYGVYRPTADCMMRRHSQPFCQICQEQYIKRIYRRSVIADERTPNVDPTVKVGERVRFSAEVIKPQHIKTIWRTRTPLGMWSNRQETADFAPTSLVFNEAGLWTVECILEDHSPKLRKPDVIRSTQQKLRWIVRVHG